jgi:predicted RNA methylase
MPNPSDTRLAPEAYSQAWELILLKSMLARLENKVAIDAGAELGEFSAGFLEAGATSVIAIEPHPYNAASLRDRFGSDPRFTVLEMAVGQEDHEALLHIAHYDRPRRPCVSFA